uniref:Uncharacterized protein n=1 Tax=Arundo donax TaxID=35708 RepID=A0A0A9E4W8_ARUDO
MWWTRRLAKDLRQLVHKGSHCENLMVQQRLQKHLELISMTKIS